MTMNEVLVEKVTVNMGVGSEPDLMKRATGIITLITGRKPVQTLSKVRIPDWGLRPGVAIGLKVTLRGQQAVDFLKRALAAKGNKLPLRSIDKNGNFGFGIKEHIDLQGVRYDPKVGILGFDVLVTLKKRGYRVKMRKLMTSKVGKKQKVTVQEVIDFVTAMGVEVI